MKEISAKTMEKVERLATKGVNKVLAPVLKRMSLEQQARMARKMIQRVGVERFTADFMSDGGFPEDIRDWKKKGKTESEVLGYYRGCSEFMKLWSELGYDITGLCKVVDGVYKSSINEN